MICGIAPAFQFGSIEQKDINRMARNGKASPNIADKLPSASVCGERPFIDDQEIDIGIDAGLPGRL